MPHDQQARDRLAIATMRLPTDVATAIDSFLHSRGLDRTALADALGVNRDRVSQLMSADPELTLQSMASVAAALDARFEIKLVPNQPGPLR
jgi:plasmid maintenance system antidote protein VapI